MQKKEKLNKMIKNMKNKNSFWTATEVEYLKQLKKAGLYITTITNNDELMKEFFPGRSYASIESKYRKI